MRHDIEVDPDASHRYLISRQRQSSLDDTSQIKRLHAALALAREIEEIPDNLLGPVHLTDEIINHFEARLVREIRIIFLHRVHGQRDVIDWIIQFMRDARCERSIARSLCDCTRISCRRSSSMTI